MAELTYHAEQALIWSLVVAECEIRHGNFDGAVRELESGIRAADELDQRAREML